MRQHCCFLYIFLSFLKVSPAEASVLGAPLEVTASDNMPSDLLDGSTDTCISFPSSEIEVGVAYEQNMVVTPEVLSDPVLIQSAVQGVTNCSDLGMLLTTEGPPQRCGEVMFCNLTSQIPEAGACVAACNCTTGQCAVTVRVIQSHRPVSWKLCEIQAFGPFVPTTASPITTRKTTTRFSDS